MLSSLSEKLFLFVVSVKPKLIQILYEQKEDRLQQETKYVVKLNYWHEKIAVFFFDDNDAFFFSILSERNAVVSANRYWDHEKIDNRLPIMNDKYNNANLILLYNPEFLRVLSIEQRRNGKITKSSKD